MQRPNALWQAVPVVLSALLLLLCYRCCPSCCSTKARRARQTTGQQETTACEAAIRPAFAPSPRPDPSQPQPTQHSCPQIPAPTPSSASAARDREKRQGPHPPAPCVRPRGSLLVTAVGCGLWAVDLLAAGCWLLHLDGDELSLLKLNPWNSSRAQTHYRPPPDEIHCILTHIPTRAIPHDSPLCSYLWPNLICTRQSASRLASPRLALPCPALSCPVLPCLPLHPQRNLHRRPPPACLKIDPALAAPIPQNHPALHCPGQHQPRP